MESFNFLTNNCLKIALNSLNELTALTSAGGFLYNCFPLLCVFLTFLERGEKYSSSKYGALSIKDVFSFFFNFGR